MWTNVFKIGGLHLVSWFQFLPYESEPSSLPDKSHHKTEEKDAATSSIISTHLQLQNEGFLSTWTNSFVGPWDPSQGVHNPDEKIKLWLFLPGRHSAINDSAQAAVSRLRVVGTGVWLAPGDSEEVALALSQALRNCIERALRTLHYVRFGDVFTKCSPFALNEKKCRRMQPTFEFVFAATEEAIFVHVILSAKHIRGLSSDDVERALRHHSCRNSGDGLPVIVPPNGMRGRLTGRCPGDLVKQVHFSKVKNTNGICVLGVPFAQSSGCRLKGQNCFVEVTVGCTSQSSPHPSRNVLQNTESHISAPGTGEKKQGSSNLEKTFIYPVETVMVPVIQRAFAKSSPKRFWLHNWVGTSLSDIWMLWDSSDLSMLVQSLGLDSSTVDSMDDLLVESAARPQQKYNSSSNSNSSSLSSISSTSSDSEYAPAVGARDLEADADSLACRQSGLSTNEQFDNNGHKMVSKRPRTGVAESCGQAGTVATATIQETYKSDYSVVEANNSASAVVTNDGIGSYWDLGDDDGDYGINIQSLLSEFGDFGDFFVNDNLGFGEPPGTAESQALVVSAVDCGDVSSSPCTGGMDVQDQALMRIGFSSFESFNQVPLTRAEETSNKMLDNMRDARSSVDDTNSSTPSSGKYDYLSKAEAMMTFAPEYAAVETPISEFSTSIFRSPYLPKSKRVESSRPCSSAYLYNATPPPSPLIETSEEKSEISTKGKLGSCRHDVNSSILSSVYYTHVQRGKKQHDKSTIHMDDDMNPQKGGAASSLSGINSSTTSLHIQGKKSVNNLEVGDFLLSQTTVLATEAECMMLQAAMCRIRHTLLSSRNQISSSLSKLTGSVISDQILSETTAMPDLVSGRHDVKKDSIPVRIAGDMDSGTLVIPLPSPVGVWRSVGMTKGTKPLSTVKVENSSSLSHNTFAEECLPANVQTQPLQVLLDAMALLVQQSTTFVDIALDAYDGEDPYCWLSLQEQQRRGFSCGPSLVHAGCGGLLAACHSLDIAGVDLVGPLSADVHASFVISLLQSDIKVALKNAFGNFDGPLSVTDWCKGRSQSGDSMAIGDGFSVDGVGMESKESSGASTLAGEPISPPQALTSGSSCLKDGTRMDEGLQRRTNQETSTSELEQQNNSSRFRPTISSIPFPALLIGYQDDWLRTSPSCIELWEKGPLEPYAPPKPMTYYVLCPDIDLLSSAAVDFFLQLGTVYETCKLGTHSPQVNGGQMEQASGKYSSSGLVLVDCPQSVKVASSNISAISTITDFFVALENGWDIKSFLKALAKALKTLKLGTCSVTNQKESKGGPCMVVYVVCPFPEPTAILQTVVEASAALGSSFLASDRERRSMLLSQVTKALTCATATDEASVSNVVMLSGFNIPKLVLQIVTVDSLLRIKPGNELAMLKEYAFTVYNKARRIPRASSTVDVLQSAVPGRSQSALMHMSSPVPGLWKDCLAPRISTSTLTRDAELDAALRPGSWDNSWQAVRSSDSLPQDDIRFLFEPLFILAEPRSIENAISHVTPGSSLSPVIDDSSGTFIQNTVSGGNADTGMGSIADGSENEQKAASLHCCYGWTEDWRWLVCIWTDSRGELLDSQVFPFGGISSRQDTKLLQCLFVQMLHQGCQILSWPSDSGNIRPRDIIITRIGFFFELERQEWQKAIFSVGGNEVKNWALQLRRSASDGVGSGNNGTSLQQDMGSIQERALPSSPSPLYSPHAKSGYMKSSLVQPNAKKQLSAGQTVVDCSKGPFQFVLSISLVGVTIDHSLQLMLPAESLSSGGAQHSTSSPLSGYLEGFSPVKSLGSISASHILIPSLSMHYLPSVPLQLPTTLTSESPPLAHLLHSKGSAIPLTSGFVVSKAVPSVRKDLAGGTREEWPSILSVSLVDYYGGSSGNVQEKYRANINSSSGGKLRNVGLEGNSRDYELETNCILETLAADLHSLSWMTVSPLYLERRTALPFHCDMVLRLRRLLHYAEKELTRPPEPA